MEPYIVIDEHVLDYFAAFARQEDKKKALMPCAGYYADDKLYLFALGLSFDNHDFDSKLSNVSTLEVLLNQEIDQSKDGFKVKIESKDDETFVLSSYIVENYEIFNFEYENIIILDEDNQTEEYKQSSFISKFSEDELSLARKHVKLELNSDLFYSDNE